MQLKLTMSTLAAALMATLASSGHATVLPYKNMQALVDEADGIVIGTVQSVQAQAMRPGDVQTFVTLGNIEALNGKVDGSTLTLRLKGGLVDGQGLHVDGAPEFAPNERVLVFVQGNGRDLVPLVGWGQGMFRLVLDPTSGQTQVQDADGNDVVGVKDGHVQRREGARLDATLLGAPAMTMAHQAPPEAGAGATDDGSQTAVVGVRALPARAMAADRFLSEVRQRAAGHAGKTLKSVMQGDSAAPAESTDGAPAATKPANQPVALPQGDAVSLPMQRLTPTATDAR